VLLIDDILDTGKTLSAVVDLIKKLNPASVKTCVLLDKKGRREVRLTPISSASRFRPVCGRLWTGFAERYRNLPCSACSSRTCKIRPSA